MNGINRCVGCGYWSTHKFCSNCGGDVFMSGKIECPYCKQMIEVGHDWQKFCVHCGKPIQEFVDKMKKGGEKDGTVNTGGESR